MYYTTYFLISLIIILSVLIILIFVPQRAKRICYISSGALFIVLFILPLLYYGTALNSFVDMYINNITEHEVWDRSGRSDSSTGKILLNYKVPLPSKTILAYRYSLTDAAYITSLAADDIIDFFSRIAEEGLYTVQDEKEHKADIKSINFKYNGDIINILIRKEGWTRRIFFINVIDQVPNKETSNSR